MSADVADAARYRFDDLLVDVSRQQVVRDDGQTLAVAGLSFRLLHYLLRQGARVVGFDELIEQVWAPAHVGEETVTQRVRLLRQALGDDGRQPRYIRSVRGVGYQLCVAPQALVATRHADVSAADATGKVHRLRRRWPVVRLLAAVLALLAIALAVAWSRREAPAPLSPLSQRAAYYAGIGQQANNDRAIALYRQRLQEAPDDSEAQLGLSRAYSTRVCQYNGSADDAAQATALAEAVRARMPDHPPAHAALGYALDCLGDVDAALAHYEQAVRLDPDADGSRASAAYLYARKGRLVDALTANLAVRDPTKARFLALQIADVLDLLGYAAAAETRYRDSFRLYPDSVFSNLAWPTFLHAHGRAGEAQAALDQALARGTDHAGFHTLAAELALLRGDVVMARQSAQRALQLRPQGSLPQSLVWFTDAAPPPSQAALIARARALLEGMANGGDPIDGLDAALLLQLAGDPAAAIMALDAAVTAGYRNAAYLQVSPLFAALRADPGYASLRARINATVARERVQIRAAGLLPDAASAGGSPSV